MLRYTLLVAVALLLSNVGAMMWGISLVPSGPPYMLKRARHLKNNARICPWKYKYGYSFVCHGRMKAPVRMYLNGRRVRTVWRAPYTMRPIRRGWIYSVNGLRYGKWITVTCKSRWGGASYHGRFYIGCGKPKPRHVRKPRKPKAKLQLLTWRRNCISIMGRYPYGGLKPRWKRTKIGGVTYRPGDKWPNVERPGTSPLTYQFWVPVKSQYAITLDMHTTHWTEHNDVFLRFPYGRGLSATKGNSVRYMGRKYVKAYHNKNGRALQAFTVDFNAHSFFTTDVLVPGKRYTIIVGARSTQTTIYAIHLFPCKGWSCAFSSRKFKRSLAQCKRIKF